MSQLGRDSRHAGPELLCSPSPVNAKASLSVKIFESHFSLVPDCELYVMLSRLAISLIVADLTNMLIFRTAGYYTLH